MEEFDEFVRARGDALLRYGYVLTGNADDAADLVQEALARLGDAWPRVRNKDDPEGYVRTTMVRLHIRSWRRRHREDLVAAVPERGEHDRYGDADLWAELQELPRKHDVGRIQDFPLLFWDADAEFYRHCEDRACEIRTRGGGEEYTVLNVEAIRR
ncbi:hypothetical protein GCM10009850_040450 [Nonomuraea monospora]|uniref:RNA polymerase sigma-70 region 2 domain-containing protein n=1 Tax=Nonomuraea monospora TaxID=568818 RepID=A0ABN3CGR8_9ACTN